MTHSPTTRRTLLPAAAALLVGTAVLAGCGTDTAVAEAGSDCGQYPLAIETPFGTTEIAEQPERVAVVTDVDLDIALALGAQPVIYPDYELGPWQVDAVAAVDDLATYDPSDGIDVEALAAAEPDVILATSGWSLEEDYDRLAEIAPVVPYTGDDGLVTMTWADRTELAGCALGLVDEAEQVVADVRGQFADAAAAHPEFAGTTITYGVVHPSQLTYSSYEGSDVSFFTDLGFVLPATAAEFDADSSLSKENINAFEADVLVMGYPFGDEGLLSREALESDPLFQSLDVVQRGGYTVLADDVASPIAYPSPLGLPWALEQVLPGLVDATS